MNTAIIVLHFGNVEDTLLCLRSLEKLKNANDVVVYVVDNGTKIITKKMLHDFSLKKKIITSKKNLGYAGGNNLGIKEALKNHHKYILLLNNDTIVDPSLLIELEAPLKRQDIGVVGCMITYLGSKRIWFAGGILNSTFCFTRHKLMDTIMPQKNLIREESVDFITGAVLFTKREVFEKIGLLPEDYFLYWEDVDFCYRATKGGYKCVIVNKPLVQHSVSAASGERGSNKLSPIRAYYYARNPFLFMKKNRLPIIPGVLTQLCIQFPYSMLLLTSYSSFLHYVKGLIDGCKYLAKQTYEKKKNS